VTGLAERKRAELRAKLATIELELGRWLAESAPAKPGEAPGTLEKHRTQIVRVAGELTVLAGLIDEALDADVKEGRLLDTWMEIEGMVLDAHQLWDFFRGKLALRYVGWLRPYLVAADELAWACYRPAQAAGTGPHHLAADEVREPPLTFFSSEGSPFALPRGRSYEGPAGAGVLRSAELRDALKSLPVPVIGVPWYQARHGPDALMLCHETGHHVEDDLRLTATLRRLLGAALDGAAVPPGRREAWQAWLGEVFADLWGVLATGPAFAGALIDFLAADPGTIAAERITGPRWGRYPSTYLRALLCFEALDLTGFAQQASAARAGWMARQPSNAMAEFEQDTRIVVEALLEGPYPEFGGVPLAAVLRFDHLADSANIDAERLLTRGYAPQSSDPRALFAAGALAFAKDPEAYARLDAAERVVAQVVASQEAGTRFRGGGDQAPAPDTLASRDALAADRLFQMLRRRAEARRQPPPPPRA
jgi:hypothetical protein